MLRPYDLPHHVVGVSGLSPPTDAICQSHSSDRIDVQSDYENDTEPSRQVKCRCKAQMQMQLEQGSLLFDTSDCP